MSFNIKTKLDFYLSEKFQMKKQIMTPLTNFDIVNIDSYKKFINSKENKYSQK